MKTSVSKTTGVSPSLPHVISAPNTPKFTMAVNPFSLMIFPLSAVALLCCLDISLLSMSIVFPLNEFCREANLSERFSVPVGCIVADSLPPSRMLLLEPIVTGLPSSVHNWTLQDCGSFPPLSQSSPEVNGELCPTLRDVTNLFQVVFSFARRFSCPCMT